MINWIKNVYKGDGTSFGNAKRIMAIIVPVILIGVIVVMIKDLKKPSVKETSNYQMTQQEVIDIFRKNKIYTDNYILSDDQYSLCSERWVRDSIKLKFDSFLHKMDMEKYIANVNDCDKFARAFTVFIKFEYKRATEKPMSSVTAGEFYYKRDKGGGHAINFVIVLDENKEKMILFYEPQTKQFVKLSDTEKNSSYFYGM